MSCMTPATTEETTVTTLTSVHDTFGDEHESAVPHVDTLDHFLAQLRHYPLLSAADEVALAKRIEAGDTAARERMIQCNLRLVVSVAKDYRNRGVAFADLIQDGTLGLIRAVDGFDWRLGNRFATYGIWWIRQSVSSSITERSRTIRLPRRIVQDLGRVFNAERDLETMLGRKPTDAEIAMRAGIKPERLIAIRRAAATAPVPIEGLVGGDDHLEAGGEEPAVDETTTVATRLDGDRRAVALARGLHALGERARRVVELRFGLDGGDERTYEEIGSELGISAWRARQIAMRAVHDLGKDAELRSLREIA